jgi:hypothetical protein
LEVRQLEPGFGGDPATITVDEVTQIAALQTDAVRIEGIEVEGSSLDRTAKVQVSINNPAASTLRDTARWTGAGDWLIEPAQDYIEVPPGETGTMTVYLTNDGNLFPVPQLELSMAYDGGGPVRISKALPVKRLIELPISEQGPEIDGELDDVWRGITPETDFFGAAPDVSPADSTLLRMCSDGISLFIVVECFESNVDELKATVETRDGFGGYDDYVLVLIEPEIGSNVFYQVAVNPKGTVFDKEIEICPFGTYVQDYAWDAALDVGVRVYDDRWVAELSIPMDALGPEARENMRWGFNFRRMHKHLGEVSDFQVPLWFATDRLGILVRQ